MLGSQDCPTPLDKVSVLKEMIFPQCEKLGQTIIFVRTREVARSLHAAVSTPSGPVPLPILKFIFRFSHFCACVVG